MSTFKNKNSLRTIEAHIVQKLKNNEARPKFTGSYKKKRVDRLGVFRNGSLHVICDLPVHLHFSNSLHYCQQNRGC